MHQATLKVGLLENTCASLSLSLSFFSFRLIPAHTNLPQTQHFSTASDGLSLLNIVLDMVVPALADLIVRPKDDSVSLKVC